MQELIEKMIADLEAEVMAIDKHLHDKFWRNRKLKDEYVTNYHTRRYSLRYMILKLAKQIKSELESEFWAKRKVGDELMVKLLESPGDKDIIGQIEALEGRCDRIAYLAWDRVDFNPCPPYVSIPCTECTGYYRMSQTGVYTLCEATVGDARKCLNGDIRRKNEFFND